MSIDSRVVRGKAFLTPKCTNEGRFSEELYGAGDPGEPIELTGISGLVGSTLGEIGGATVGLLGDALKKAAQSRAYSIESTLSYAFYGAKWVDPDDADPAQDNEQDAEASGGRPTIGCLNLIATTKHLNLQPEKILDPRPHLTGPEVYREQGASEFELEPLDFALEIDMIDRGDALELRPIHINYFSPIPKFPNRSLPGEIQVTFSKPSANGQDSFAIARIPLQPVKPGDIWWEHQLNYHGIRIPLRPKDGGEPNGPNGSTNVTIRFVLYKDENKFLKSVGEILSGKKADFETYISREISAKPNWTEAMAYFEQGKLELRYAQEDLNLARDANNMEGIREAEREILRAKSKINSASVSMGRVPPYPLEN